MTLPRCFLCAGSVLRSGTVAGRTLPSGFADTVEDCGVADSAPNTFRRRCVRCSLASVALDAAAAVARERGRSWICGRCGVHSACVLCSDKGLLELLCIWSSFPREVVPAPFAACIVVVVVADVDGVIATGASAGAGVVAVVVVGGVAVVGVGGDSNSNNRSSDTAAGDSGGCSGSGATGRDIAAADVAGGSCVAARRFHVGCRSAAASVSDSRIRGGAGAGNWSDGAAVAGVWCDISVVAGSWGGASAAAGNGLGALGTGFVGADVAVGFCVAVGRFRV